MHGVFDLRDAVILKVRPPTPPERTPHTSWPLYRPQTPFSGKVMCLQRQSVSSFTKWSTQWGLAIRYSGSALSTKLRPFESEITQMRPSRRTTCFPCPLICSSITTMALQPSSGGDVEQRFLVPSAAQTYLVQIHRYQHRQIWWRMTAVVPPTNAWPSGGEVMASRDTGQITSQWMKTT